MKKAENHWLSTRTKFKRIKNLDIDTVTNGVKDVFGYLTKSWTWWISFTQG